MKSSTQQHRIGASDGDALRKHAQAASEMLKAISNPHRLMILCALVKREHSVGELGERVDLSMSALSQHLAVLKRQGLVSTRREAQSIFYSLADNDIQILMHCLHEIYCG